VETHWKFRNKEHAEKIAQVGFDYILLDEQDKECVRNNIMAAVCEQVQVKLIQKQYVRSLKYICSHDYPSKLPNLLPQIMSYLKSQNQL
jgi:hypothetical protein